VSTVTTLPHLLSNLSLVFSHIRYQTSCLILWPTILNTCPCYSLYPNFSNIFSNISAFKVFWFQIVCFLLSLKVLSCRA
jgi:hypothetical protein